MDNFLYWNSIEFGLILSWLWWCWHHELKSSSSRVHVNCHIWHDLSWWEPTFVRILHPVLVLIHFISYITVYFSRSSWMPEVRTLWCLTFPIIGLSIFIEILKDYACIQLVILSMVFSTPGSSSAWLLNLRRLHHFWPFVVCRLWVYLAPSPVGYSHIISLRTLFSEFLSFCASFHCCTILVLSVVVEVSPSLTPCALAIVSIVSH
jgi:hypothetical protein